MATNTEKIVVQVVVQGEKDLQKLEKRTGSTTKSFGKMAAGVLGAVAAFRQVSQSISSAIKSFRDYEFQMAKVKAITGANRTEFLKLSKTAQDLGRSTFFTAQQVAELQTNFGKLGFSTKEILNAQEATLQLATATDSDLARAAIVAGSAVRGFGLDASETQRVVDVMAVAFTSSALDIEKFQTSMTKVAPIAKSAGFSIEDTTAIMSQLADSGIEASIAGTSLRNILLKMQDPNSDLVKSFGKTIHSLDELVPALTKFSEEGGSLAEIMEVVDSRQAAAFEQMITSRKRTVELRDALKDANGAAEEMARIVGDTLEGALKRSESATQGFAIAFMDTFGKTFQNIVDGFASFVNVLTDFVAIPISEKLEEDRLSMNNLFNALQETNISQDTRNKLLAKLNLEYGEYLPRLVTEKTSLEDLKKAQVEANAAMLQRVTILAAEERLTEIRKKQIDNEIEAADLIVKKQELANKQLETNNILLSEHSKNINEDVKSQQARLSVEQGITAAITDNTNAIQNNKNESEELNKEYETASKVALELGVNVDELMKSLDVSTEKTNKSTAATTANTQAKKDNKQATELQAEADRDYFHIMNLVLDGTMTQKEAEEALRLERMMAIQDALDAMPLIYSDLELRTKLEKELIDLKLKGISDEKTARQEQIDGVAQLGDQLINLAGEDEKMQGIKKAGIALSSAAAIANNIQALSEMTLGVTSQAKLPFPANIIGMVTTLSTVVSLLANIKAMKGAFGDGGIVETFANGGMVHGKSHAQGGEKFAVGGRVVELEGGEAVINKRSTAMFSRQLSAMNAAGGGVKFADGGLLNMPSFSQQQFNALGQSQMMGAMGSSGKVVVVESDITDSQNTVNVIQSEATI
tara:strand:+ start:9123 stop:11732 length:2610 start_codon:yes stop_codon:yes gene_type:complete